jgi:hypothetical protein
VANLPLVETHNNKQTREKSQVVMKDSVASGRIMLPQTINFKAETYVGPFSLDSQGLYTALYPLDFDLGMQFHRD